MTNKHQDMKGSPSRSPSPAAFKAEGGRKLAVIGGRLEDNNTSVYAEMHRLSGGRILVFPTASSEPVEVGKESLEAFQSHGFEVEIAPLYGRNAPRVARDSALLQKIADYGSVYFTGGDQAKILKALSPDGEETPALAAIRAAQMAGGLVAGSSAGAAIMSQPMLLGGTSLESVVHGVTQDPDQPGLLLGRGLGLFPFGMVDQHFIKRGRLGRMVVAMAEAGQTRGFGIDENTALIIEGAAGKVCGEYGVMMLDLEGAELVHDTRNYSNFALSYLDDGDTMDLRKFRFYAGEGKRKAGKADIAYRAPVRSRRNAFGAYTLYDLMARLVLSDSRVYHRDVVEAFDAKSGYNVEVALARVARKTKCFISTPDDGLRMTALDFDVSISTEQLNATRLADRLGHRGRTYAMPPKPESRIILLGSSPLNSAPEMLADALKQLAPGTVGVLACASSEPRRTAEDHISVLRKLGVQAVDFGVTINNVDYIARNADLLESIEKMSAILLCGGNQIRLVDTLLHRGEESAVLRAIAKAHANGVPLIAASGAASALSGVMIAGGSTYEALRFGVSSDVGHRGLAIQEGIGLFSTGIVDQNLLRSDRMGRLVVACAEENERFGIGVLEDSAVIATQAGCQLEAVGKSGFLLIEIDPLKLVLQNDSFVANGVRLTLLGPGDRVDLNTNEITRLSPVDASVALLEKMVAGLAEEAGAAVSGSNAGIHGVMIRPGDSEGATAYLDLECPRDDNA